MHANSLNIKPQACNPNLDTFMKIHDLKGLAGAFVIAMSGAVAHKQRRVEARQEKN